MDKNHKLLVVDVAALGWDLVARGGGAPAVGDLPLRRIETVFPALTCPVQASFRTEALPCFHGLTMNGYFDRRLSRPLFWEQSAALVYGRRIWESFRGQGGRVGLMFWQQSLGEHVDLLLSPKPIHKHHGGMIQDCYGRPHGLYAGLVKRVGSSFPLMNYWGPLASRRSSDWIVAAVEAVLAWDEMAPDLLLAYLPHLDYDLQRFGPGSPEAATALAVTLGYLQRLRRAAAAHGYDVLFFGDYAMTSVNGPAVFPNRALKEAGLLDDTKIRGRSYPDLYGSGAFAVVDHEVAGLYARTPEDAQRARDVLERIEGIGEILDREAQRQAGIDDPNGADLFLVAEQGRWFAYPWWTADREAPDYASHVDIHNKPGYDPCELFFGFPPPRVSLDPARIRGTHGRAGPDRAVAWATSLALDREPQHLMNLAKACQDHLERPL